MTKRETIRGHRKLWGWLAKNPGGSKYSWPGWAWNGGKYPGMENDCFLCGYTLDEDGLKDCSKCLGSWRKFSRFKWCHSKNGHALYEKWTVAAPMECARLALKIRDVVDAQ